MKPQDRWEIRIPKEQYSKLREDAPFHQIIILARAVNVVRFLESSFLDADSNSPAASRKHLNAFFLWCATSFEANRLTQTLRKNFRGYSCWDSGLGALLREKRFQELVWKHLKPLRDQTVSHYFEDSLGDLISDHQPDNVVFCSGTGRTSGELFYDLPDLLAMRLFVGKKSMTDDDFLEESKRLMTDARDYLLTFVVAAEVLIAEYCKTIQIDRRILDDGTR